MLRCQHEDPILCLRCSNETADGFTCRECFDKMLKSNSFESELKKKVALVERFLDEVLRSLMDVYDKMKEDLYQTLRNIGEVMHRLKNQRQSMKGHNSVSVRIQSKGLKFRISMDSLKAEKMNQITPKYIDQVINLKYISEKLIAIQKQQRKPPIRMVSPNSKLREAETNKAMRPTVDSQILKTTAIKIDSPHVLQPRTRQQYSNIADKVSESTTCSGSMQGNQQYASYYSPPLYASTSYAPEAKKK